MDLNLHLNRRQLLQASAAAAITTSLGTSSFAADAPAAAFKLPPLPYAADSLVPHIDAKTMEIHHGKHHNAYVTKLNEAVAKLPKAATGTQQELVGWLSNLEGVPEEIRAAVRNHGGGHYNHTLFWDSLSSKGGEIKGDLAKGIESAFQSTDAFLTALQDTGAKVFGSGWAWLVYDPKVKGLALASTSNQDTPLAAGQTPLLGIDVWEHAYYLNYQNRRPDYLKAILNVINWDVVADRYNVAKG